MPSGLLPYNILGSSSGAKGNKMGLWNPVLLKIHKRIGCRKNRTLSKAGRLTLRKSVLSSMPLYYMSLFVMPKGVSNQLNRIFRQFFWNEKDIKRRIHTVRWEQFCTDKGKGGLGLKDLQAMNQALLCKWHRRLAIRVMICGNQLSLTSMGGPMGPGVQTK